MSGETKGQRPAEAMPDDLDEIKFSTRDLLAFRNLPRRESPSPLERVAGKWPGDETDEEIHAAMEEQKSCASGGTGHVVPKAPVKIAEPKRSPVVRAASPAAGGTPSVLAGPGQHVADAVLGSAPTSGSAGETDNACPASDEERAQRWVWPHDEYEPGNLNPTIRSLAKLLGDVRRETVEACARKLESVERKLKLDDNGTTHIALYDDELKPLAKWLRAQMASDSVGAAKDGGSNG